MSEKKLGSIPPKATVAPENTVFARSKNDPRAKLSNVDSRQDVLDESAALATGSKVLRSNPGDSLKR